MKQKPRNDEWALAECNIMNICWLVSRGGGGIPDGDDVKELLCKNLNSLNKIFFKKQKKLIK